MAEAGRETSLPDRPEESENPWVEPGKRHFLLDIITIALSAVICGADSWVDAARFGRGRDEWFRTFLELPNCVPSHDTFGDLFSRLDPYRFPECFMDWSQGVEEGLPGNVAATNGRTALRSHGARTGKEHSIRSAPGPQPAP